MTGFVLIPKDVATDIRVMLASIGQPDYLPVKGTPERRMKAERLYRELLTARSAKDLVAAEQERDLAIRSVSDGWLYHCPDTGTEWSEQHPVESGEVPDAEDVRAATATAFLNELIPTWEALAEERSLRKREGAKFAKMRKALEALADFVRHGNNAEGHCMCGSPMEGHDIYDNHSPVDMGEYHAEQLVKRAEAALRADATQVAEIPEPILKAVERILDEHSAWVARPNAEVTRKIAFAVTVAAYTAVEQANEEEAALARAAETATGWTRRDLAEGVAALNGEALSDEYLEQADHLLAHLSYCASTSTPKAGEGR